MNQVFSSAQTFASAENAVNYFFTAARSQAHACEKVLDSKLRHALALGTVMLSCAAVEAFLNVWLQQRLNFVESPTPLHARLANELESKNCSIWHKLTKWPNALFSAGLPERAADHPPYQNFVALYERRNRLMHYRSTNETLQAGKFKADHWTDVTEIKSLTADDALESIRIAEGIVVEIERMRIAHMDPNNDSLPEGALDLLTKSWVEGL